MLNFHLEFDKLRGALVAAGRMQHPATLSSMFANFARQNVLQDVRGPLNGSGRITLLDILDAAVQAVMREVVITARPDPSKSRTVIAEVSMREFSDE